MGLFIWMDAAADGFKMDDPYPGYGKISRKHEEIIHEYTDEKTNIIDDLSHTRDQALEYIRNARQSLAEDSSTLSNALDCRSRLMHNFEEHQVYLNRAANDLLSVYRNANMGARTAPAPGYFNNSYALPKPLAAPPLPNVINKMMLEARVGETDEALKDAINLVATQFEKAVGEFRQIGEFTREGQHVV